MAPQPAQRIRPPRSAGDASRLEGLDGRLARNQKFLHAIELVTRDDHWHRDFDDGLGLVFATGLVV